MQAGERSRLGSAAVVDRGFTYLWLLSSIALLGLALAWVGPAWQKSVQREREAQLLRVGLAYAQAIERYYFAQGLRQYPERLEDLLLDPRFSAPVRHLRALYADPMIPGQAMEAVRAGDGRVVGVRSRSAAMPLHRQTWIDGRRTLPPVDRYSDWQFVAEVGR